MLKYENQKVVEVDNWDSLVIETYGKPYNFQQQDGCRDRGIVYLTVPSSSNEVDEDMHDSIPEKINSNEMGVKFQVWLDRDPKKPVEDRDFDEEDWSDDSMIEMFWHRNFYPDYQTVANDLHAKGLIEAGDYIINIDW